MTKRQILVALAIASVLGATGPQPVPALANDESSIDFPFAQRDSASSELREAVRLDPANADAHFALGLSLSANGDRSGAIEEWRKAVRLKPDHAQAHYRLGLALLTSPQAEAPQEDLAHAITELRAALRLQPGHVEARYSLAQALYQAGDLDEAIETFRTVLRLRPDLAPAHVQLAAALMAKHDWTGALAALQAALHLQPDVAQAHDRLGIVRYTIGDYDGAIEAYRQALRLKPDYADAHYHLALVLKLTNQEADAAREFLEAAQAGIPKAQYFLGNAYAAGLGVERNLALAIAWWVRAADQEVSQAKEALAHLRQMAVRGGARARDEARAAQQAFAEYRRTIFAEFPDLQAEADEESVGALLMQQGRLEQAVPTLIREALALSEPAQGMLEALYERGVEGQMPAYDRRIFAYLKMAAEEGLPRPRLALARIYARGLGVPRDLNRAGSLLKGYPGEEANGLLHEIAALQEENQPRSTNTRPDPVKRP